MSACWKVVVLVGYMVVQSDSLMVSMKAVLWAGGWDHLKENSRADD
jgi:hypothetical protein